MQSVAEARIKPKSSKSHASAFTTGLSSLPVKEHLHLSRAKQGKWQWCFASFLQQKQKIRVTAQPGGTEDRALGAAVSSGNLFWQLMKMCYSQRPPYPKLWVASTSWTVWTTSPLPPCSVSGGVTERWTLGLAELIYLHLLCFSPMPASPQNICFMFYIAALIGSNAECSVTGSFFGYHSQAATLFFIPNWTTLPGQIWKHNQSNCWDSACVLRESPHAILTSQSPPWAVGQKGEEAFWPS